MLIAISMALAFAPPGLHVQPAARVLRTPAVSMSNPLAKFFGGDKKEEKGGELSSQMTSGLDQLLKDASLPVKMMASLAKPLIGALGDALEESQANSDALLQEAQGALRADGRVTALR